MSKLRRILVATDGTNDSAAAVEVASSVARHVGAEVRFVQVCGLDTRHRHSPVDAAMRGQALRSQFEALERMRLSGVVADGELVHSDPTHVGAAICEVARHCAADLLVLGTGELHDWRSLGDPDPNDSGTGTLECPVLLVRARTAPVMAQPLRVLLALANESDLSQTLGPASSAGEPLTVLVVQIEPESQGPALVDTALQALHEAHVEADGWLLHRGQAEAVVAGVAARWQPDVIVLGSPQTSELGRALPAHVIPDLLRQPAAPVMVA